MLADIGAGRGEGIVLADQAHRVGAAPLVHQCNISGNIHAGGAQGHAGHWVFQASQAAMMENVLLIVVPKALETHQDQLRRIYADGTVRRVHNDLGRIFDPPQDPHRRIPVQYFPDHVGKLRQSDAAGHALAAGLCLTEVEKIQRHIHRTQARRAGGNPPLHIPVKLFHHGLGLAGHFDFQSAHLG